MTPTQIQQWTREAGFSTDMQLAWAKDFERLCALARADSERMTEQVIAGADLARADLEAENERLNDDVAMHMRVAVKAIDECVELKAENEKLRNHIKHIGNDALRGENASLKAEVESLRQQVRKEQMYVQELAADAARYHGFRKALMEDDDAFIDRAADLIPDEDVPITADMVDAAFDAAIDAAMEKTK